MKCPECQKKGDKSEIYIGMSTRTLLGWQQYYDKDGILHDKDPNHTTTEYECSKGHKWKDIK
ncbi:MAG: hypothetical protein UT24_C0016G0038 [Candidatus Woesebacteria bacterium GW2011_GWB1_39_12]|uniref:Uncharacterized protein n=1 Tax=Candidatus Woesebacteria bacterium GW2011_GWB1_39_12 TaxID=1618574 RepID=A0A0G0M7Q4_9BACT|nr:MAG: hypothetical protein UT24_C0016G0038 [Candidatus Woesebacteria bacterium GW2011_GWB1_39_12]